MLTRRLVGCGRTAFVIDEKFTLAPLQHSGMTRTFALLAVAGGLVAAPAVVVLVEGGRVSTVGLCLRIAFPVIVLALLAIGRARVGSAVGPAGVTTRNVWRTCRLPWADIVHESGSAPRGRAEYVRVRTHGGRGPRLSAPYRYRRDDGYDKDPEFPAKFVRIRVALDEHRSGTPAA